MTENVYSKLQKARVELQGKNLKKSGKNTFAKYDYFELGDFLPHVNDIFANMGLFSQVTFTTEVATLTIYNSEKPEEHIVFTSPMAEASLKGVHAIQNAGAVQSYQRRYLYLAAMEITENDVLDATTGADKPTGRNEQPPRPKYASKKQVEDITAIVDKIVDLRNGEANSDDVYNALRTNGYKFNNPEDVLEGQAGNMIKQLQSWLSNAEKAKTQGGQN